MGVESLTQEGLSTVAPAARQIRIPSHEELRVFVPDREVLDANHIVGFNNRHINARPFSLLRSQLIKRFKSDNIRSLGVTSPAPGAGKSFLTSNLAASLSRLPNRRVHVFDLDLRRATLAKNFGLEGDVGLEDFLAGKTDNLRDVGVRIEGTSVSLYPCFDNDYDSMPLLAGERFVEFAQALRSLPDDNIVICDLPPVFANDDAMIVAAQLDSYLMVVEQGRTSRKQVTDSMRLLEPAVCIGSVLNRYEGGLGDSYGYGYGYGYGKYSEYYATDG